VYSLGAPAAAAGYLRRALELDPAPGVRAEIQLQLGAAAIRALDGRAVEHLRGAVADAGDPVTRRSALIELARAQLAVLDLDAASATFEEALTESRGDREQELSAEAELASAQLNLNRFEEAASRIRGQREGLLGATAAERKLLAVAAFAAAQSNEPAEVVRGLGSAALGDGALIEEQTCASVIVIEVLLALIMVEAYDLAGAALEHGIDDARGRGWPIGFATASTLRAWMHLRRGELGLAEADARAAEDVRLLHGAAPLDPFVSAYLIEVLGERGRLDEAEALLADRCPKVVPEAAVFQLILFARGRTALARGDLETGLADVLEAGRRELGFGGLTPAAMPWRSVGAAAMAALGQRDEAQRLAGGELELAQAMAAPRAIGIALRGVALADLEADPIATLERSVAELRKADASLELARSLTELGAAMRRDGRQREAREPLREAAELAASCGADALEQRAGDELGATGEHQRRGEVEGLEALTPSELRAARMAAAGRSNRQIAQDLFVTARTIEIHLTRTYRKLGIRSRRELTEALVAYEAAAEAAEG
jgi:DNA-binding CsgD family transcriptional regulator